MRVGSYCLQLDAGIDEKIMLVSRDEQSCLIVSYREVRLLAFLTDSSVSSTVGSCFPVSCDADQELYRERFRRLVEEHFVILGVFCIGIWTRACPVVELQ